MNHSMQTVPAGKGGKVGKAVGIVFGVLLTLFLASLAVVFPKQGEIFIELGDKAPVNPGDYLFGYPFVVNHARIDAEDVNTDKVGAYQVNAELLFYHYTIDVTVRDTTPPEIVPFQDELYIATGREYAPEDFAAKITDLSGDVSCGIRYDGSELSSVSFPEQGHYSVTLEARDASGNTGSCEIGFTVDDPPVIIGAFDRHLPVGTDFNLKVVAVDTGDGVLSDHMLIDKGGFNSKKEGDYTVIYSVTDSHGLRTEKSITLSVCNKRKLSLYNDKDDLSLTPEEMRLLCGADYFSYQPLDVPDYDTVLDMIEPTLLDFKQTRSNGYAAGSGCIYRVTPEWIYMLSVQHVMKEVSRDCSIMFFDGTVVKEDIAYATSKQKNELAMFKIPVSDVPTDTLLSLKQICVDTEVYTGMSEGDEVVAFAKHWSGTNQDKITRMKVKKLRVSIRDFGLYDSLMETTEGVVSGMSGTAVVDLRGRLVGLASAIGPSTDSDRIASSYHSRIDVLAEAENALEEGNKAA